VILKKPGVIAGLFLFISGSRAWRSAAIAPQKLPLHRDESWIGCSPAYQHQG
jgi:hypothetical protein